MADSYSWLNLSMRLRFCAGATKVHKIILVAINASMHGIKYCHDTGRPFKGAWLKDRESTANFFSARIYMKVIDNLY